MMAYREINLYLCVNILSSVFPTDSSGGAWPPRGRKSSFSSQQFSSQLQESGSTDLGTPDDAEEIKRVN